MLMWFLAICVFYLIVGIIAGLFNLNIDDDDLDPLDRL